MVNNETVITVRISKELRCEIEKIAQDNNVTTSAIIKIALSKYVKGKDSSVL